MDCLYPENWKICLVARIQNVHTFDKDLNFFVGIHCPLLTKKKLNQILPSKNWKTSLRINSNTRAVSLYLAIKKKTCMTKTTRSFCPSFQEWRYKCTKLRQDKVPSEFLWMLAMANVQNVRIVQCHHALPHTCSSAANVSSSAFLHCGMFITISMDYHQDPINIIMTHAHNCLSSSRATSVLVTMKYKKEIIRYKSWEVCWSFGCLKSCKCWYFFPVFPPTPNITENTHAHYKF
jgi:hypothetical protein